jgi:hypothetical protein
MGALWHLGAPPRSASHAPVPRFEPFRGVLYDTERLDLAQVTAPPYDVIDDEERSLLVVWSPVNVVHVYFFF